ncbi:hypothetical protein D9M71_607230 [compost metagenome]
MCSSTRRETSSKAGCLFFGSTGTWKYEIPCHSTMLRRSSWLAITQGISQSSSPLCQRCSRSARQWDSRLAISTTRFFTAESVMRHSIENSRAIGAKAWRKPSRSKGRESARISWRMKNQPL